MTETMGRVVEKPYNGGEWSHARFMGFLRSTIRRASVRWNPRAECLKAARRPNQSANARLKWEYLCAECRQWLPGKEVEADHVVPCGSLKTLADLPGFVARTFVEVDGFRCICKPCHKKKTHG